MPTGETEWNDLLKMQIVARKLKQGPFITPNPNSTTILSALLAKTYAWVYEIN